MNFNIRSFFIFLILFVFSKEVIVFNEEVLILFSFSIFIYLVYNLLSNSISLELDNRSSKIQQEFTQYREVQKSTLSYLISYHDKQTRLLADIETIFNLTKVNVELIIRSYSELFIKNLYNLVEDKLKRVLINELKYKSLLQTKINNELNIFLCSGYLSSKNRKK